VALLVAAAVSAPESAAHWYEAALRLLPDRDRARLLGPAGLALARAGRVREAEARLAELDSAEPELVITRAQLEVTLGDVDAARRRSRAATPSPEAALELAAIEGHLDELTALRDLGDEALVGKLPSLVHVARAQLRHARLDDAAEVVERAFALAEHNKQPLVALHELRAEIRLRQLDLDGALSDAEAA
jgi:hypothetical protein